MLIAAQSPIVCVQVQRRRIFPPATTVFVYTHHGNELEREWLGRLDRRAVAKIV